LKKEYRNWNYQIILNAFEYKTFAFIELINKDHLKELISKVSENEFKMLLFSSELNIDSLVNNRSKININYNDRLNNIKDFENDILKHLNTDIVIIDNPINLLIDTSLRVGCFEYSR